MGDGAGFLAAGWSFAFATLVGLGFGSIGKYFEVAHERRPRSETPSTKLTTMSHFSAGRSGS